MEASEPLCVYEKLMFDHEMLTKKFVAINRDVQVLVASFVELGPLHLQKAQQWLLAYQTHPIKIKCSRSLVGIHNTPYFLM